MLFFLQFWLMRVLIPLVVLLFTCCAPDQKTSGETGTDPSSIQFAQKFRVNENGVEVLEPWPGAVQSINYDTGNPPKTIICTSTTHLPFLELLGVENTLIGFPGTQYISSEKIRNMVEQGRIIDVGGDGKLNLELIIGMDPDLVIAFDMGNESTVLDKLPESGIPVVYNADFLETSPLGRAEWIKFFGKIFQKQQRADSIFDEIVFRYDSLKSLTSKIQLRPDVLSGVVYGDVWFLPGGKNWSAQFFNDAGGNYFLKDNDKTGWLELDFEYVFDKARQCEFWIGVASFQSREEMKDQDSRYAAFEAFENRRVFNHSKRIGTQGGYDIFESGYARPDRVLADIIRILHPQLLPQYETYYYELLP